MFLKQMTATTHQLQTQWCVIDLVALPGRYEVTVTATNGDKSWAAFGLLRIDCALDFASRQLARLARDERDGK